MPTSPSTSTLKPEPNPVDSPFNTLVSPVFISVSSIYCFILVQHLSQRWWYTSHVYHHHLKFFQLILLVFIFITNNILLKNIDIFCHGSDYLPLLCTHLHSFVCFSLSVSFSVYVSPSLCLYLCLSLWTGNVSDSGSGFQSEDTMDQSLSNPGWSFNGRRK